MAVDKGLTTLRESAIGRVLAGYTSLDEAINKTQTEEAAAAAPKS